MNAIKNTVAHQATLMQGAASHAEDQQDIRLLQNIEYGLQQLQKNNSYKDAEMTNQQALQQVAGQLSVLIQSQKSLASTTNSQLAPLKTYQDNFEKQNTDVQKQLSAIHKAVVPEQYLSINALPFQVEGLSFWNGKPMVTISMLGINGQHFYKLIGQDAAYGCQSTFPSKGCSNWTVASINTDSGIVIFKNLKGQLVKVTL